MIKRILLAVAAVFVAWQITDFVIHGVLLKQTYEATAQFWRPMAEMKQGLMMAVSLLTAICFVGLYGILVRPKSLVAGLKYGAILGLAFGFTMGYGTYSYMPVPYHLAMSWFLSAVFQKTLAGALIGWIVQEQKQATVQTEAV